MDDHSSRKGDNTVRHVRETTEPLLVRTRHSPPNLTPDSYCRVAPTSLVVALPVALLGGLLLRSLRWGRGDLASTGDESDSV